MDLSRRDVIKGALAVAATQVKAAPLRGYLWPVQAHLEKLIDRGIDVYGPVKTAMWMASLNTKTGRYPDLPLSAIGQRVYREIAAPRGSTIYWDQPQLVAACAMTGLTGDPHFKHAVDDYVKAFFENRGVDENGLFEWGNHRYYDAFTDEVVHFQGGPHEMRPLSPAWEIFWRLAPKATEHEIRVAAVRHVFDPKTGGFNRHDDGKPGCAFLEAGGVLVESLCWLARKKNDQSLIDKATLIAHYTFSYRDPNTGLVENNPTVTRWDKWACTTEIGLWAASLIRAADTSGKTEFIKMADAAMSAYLHYGYDVKSGEYFGKILVKDGTPAPDMPEARKPVPPGEVAIGNVTHHADGTISEEDYYPGRYADIWNAVYPAHDFPMAFAETCVELYRRTKGPQYREAVERWVGVVKQNPPPASARDGHGAYAELFGRAIYFLTDAGVTFNNPQYTVEAHKLADISLDTLFAYGMFRGHASEDRYDAVDGVGYLLLALIYLETGRKPDFLAFGI